jgi:hypothetical protein
MSTNVTLKAVPKGPTTEKKKREQIELIETPPKLDWFVSAKERGRTVWYLRFIVTGMLPRRFGPFANRHKALLALDGMINVTMELENEIRDQAKKYGLNRRFQLQPKFGPVIEDAIALPKGR